MLFVMLSNNMAYVMGITKDTGNRMKKALINLILQCMYTVRDFDVV